MVRERSSTRPHRRGAVLALLVTGGILLCFHAALGDPSADKQQRALRGHLTPKRTAADCAHVLRLTPEEAAELGWFHYHRALMDCKDVDDLLNDDVKTPAEKNKGNTKDTIDKEYKNTIEGREGWMPTTPDEIKARADAEARDKKLAADQAELDAKQAELAKQQAETKALAEANAAKYKEYLANLQKESDARTAEAQKVYDARSQVELDRVQKANDDIRAAQDAETREQLDTAEKADLERQKANEEARAAENTRLAQDKVQRDADKLQEETDARQAEADKQSADAEQKAKNEAQRQQNAEARTANEQARQQRETEFRANEEARVARERDAEIARLEREKTEADIKKEEDARAQREKNLAENEKVLAAREKEFVETDAARAERLKKMKEDEDARAAEEQKARDADKDKADDLDGKQKDLDKQNEDIPHEEKPKRDDEDDCDVSSGEKVTCHNGGKCYQLRADPSKKRCKCEKGYKGEKCEYASCSVTGADKKVKTGNTVDGKCVRWDSDYSCPGCNKNWNLLVQCVEIGPTGKEKNVSSHDCSKMKKPENEFKGETCKYCPTGCKVRRHLREEATAAATPAPPTHDFKYTQSCNSFPDRAFIYSEEPHVFPTRIGKYTIPVPAREDDNVSMEDCLELCWEARGRLADRTQYYRGDYELTSDHCTWVFWKSNGATTTTFALGKCQLYNNGNFPLTGGSAPVTGGGMLAFVSFTRRFDISRTSDCYHYDRANFRTSQDGVVHQVCFGKGTREGEGTSYIGNPDLPCPATYETMLDAALHYEDLSGAGRGGGGGDLAFRVAVPDDIKILHPSRPSGSRQFSVLAGASRQKWTYSIDTLGRVFSVSAAEPLIPLLIGGANRDDLSPPENQVIFNYEMHNTKVGRPFQAGHLAAAQQWPPNFFFNYVPQHGNSNTGDGCWYNTEIAASDFQRMGCYISYDIVLTYPKEGDTLFETGMKRPSWVRDRDQPSAYTVPAGTNAMNPRCHFRFRPVTMGLTFRILDVDQGSTCDNLRASMDPSWNGGSLVVIQREADDKISLIVSRVNAFLLQRWTLGHAFDRGPAANPDATQFKKLYSVATAMSNAFPEVKCYAETGYYFPFYNIQFTPGFRLAFISTEDNSGCLVNSLNGLTLSATSASCTKWTYPDGVSDSPTVPGVEIYPDGQQYCNLAGYEETCAKFVYFRDPRHVAPRYHSPLVDIRGEDGAAATEHRMILDDLVRGTVEINGKCILTMQLQNFATSPVLRSDLPVPADRKDNCLRVRVSYYPII